jgi:O-antigen/teichoic acid export membrane protein
MFEFISGILKTAENDYGINPIVFAILYFGSIPLFMVSLAWLLRNIRQKRQLIVPALCSIIFFLASYLYLIVAGDNIPVWIYLVIAAAITGGIVLALLTARRELTRRTEKP